MLDIRFLNYLRAAVWRVATAIWPYVALLISCLEIRRMVLSTEVGANAPDQLGSRVVIFVHFDKGGRIHDHTRAYIDALRDEGLDIVFVTNAQRLAPLDRAWLGNRAARVVIRRNMGYDFAAWRDAMLVCSLPAPNTRLLLLANDSVYGPMRHLGPVLNKIDFDKADVWGATDSWQYGFHLQSFFLVFGPEALRHEAFEQFWRSIRNVRSKEWVVRHYEIGLSRSLTAAGLRCKALWPYLTMIEVLRNSIVLGEGNKVRPDDATAAHHNTECRNYPQRKNDGVDAYHNTKRLVHIASMRIPLNPTADLWRVLIEQGFPFLKCELLRKNPSRVPDVAAWSSVVDKIEGFDRDIILRDLEKSLERLSP